MRLEYSQIRYSRNAVMLIALVNIPYQIHIEPYVWMLLPIFCLPIFEKNMTNEH